MKYRAEIDGLRALAVIPVILYHAGFKLFGGGFIGVDVFFVISGYLITSIIFAELETGSFSLMHFYERRARRVLPALFVVMFACLPFAWFWMLPDAMEQFLESLVATSTFVSNISFWRTSGYFDSATELKPLIHTWSLALEEQYYLLFPIFMIATWKLGKRWIYGLLTVVFVFSLAGAQLISATHYQQFGFYMLPTRGWELLIGAFIAIYQLQLGWKKVDLHFDQLGSLIGLLLIIYPVFAFNSLTPFPSIYSLVPTIGAALIIIYATHQTVVGKLLGSKPLVAIGLISYSAYLWHQPIFAFAKIRSLDEPSACLMIMLAVLSFGFAYLSYKYVESPFRNRNKISRNQVFLYGILLSVLFIGIGFAGNKLKTPTLWELQNPNLINKSLLKENSSVHSCNVDLKKYGDADCVVRGSGNRVIVVWGDSHATVLSKIVPEISGVKIYVISHHGCPPVIGVRRFDGLGNSFSCNNTNILASYAKFIESLKPETVVLVGRWTLYLNGFHRNKILQGQHHFLSLKNDDDVIKPLAMRCAILSQQLNYTVNYFSKHSNVILLTQPPDYANYPLNKLQRTNFSVSVGEIMQWHKSEFEVLQGFKNSYPRVKVLDSKTLFCNYEQCNSRANGVLIYSDDNHLTYDGAKRQWDMIIRSSGL